MMLTLSPFTTPRLLRPLASLLTSLSQICIGDLLGGLIDGLGDKYVGYLVLLGACGMPVHGVVGHVDLAAYEPLGVGLASS